MANDAVVYIRGSIAHDVHLGFRTNLAPLADAKLSGFFWSFLLAVAMPIEGEEVKALIKANNDNILNSFEGLLEQIISQIKRSNKE